MSWPRCPECGATDGAHAAGCIAGRHAAAVVLHVVQQLRRGALRAPLSRHMLAVLVRKPADDDAPIPFTIPKKDTNQ